MVTGCQAEQLLKYCLSAFVPILHFSHYGNCLFLSVSVCLSHKQDIVPFCVDNDNGRIWVRHNNRILCSSSLLGLFLSSLEYEEYEESLLLTNGLVFCWLTSLVWLMTKSFTVLASRDCKSNIVQFLGKNIVA